MSQPWLNTPRAMLIAGSVIGIGLFLGLYLKQPDPAHFPKNDAETVPPAQPAQDSNSASSLALPPESSSPETVSKDVVERAARAALAAKHGKLVEQCWTPFFEKNPDPPVVKYVIQMNFDAEGKQVGMGVNDIRGFLRAETSECLRAQPLDITIPPPGAPVRVKVDLSLP